MSDTNVGINSGMLGFGIDDNGSPKPLLADASTAHAKIGISGGVLLHGVDSEGVIRPIKISEPGNAISVGAPISNVVRTNLHATDSFVAGTSTGLGIGSATFWPILSKVRNLRVVFYLNDLDYEQATPVTITGCIMDKSNEVVNHFPLLFSGQSSVIGAPGALVVSDPLPIIIDPGEIEVRCYALAADGHKIPVSNKAVLKYGYSADLFSETDYSDGSTVTDDGSTAAFTPLTLIGETLEAADKCKVYVIGDSIAGKNNHGRSNLSALHSSIFQQALGNIDVPTCILGFGGNQPYNQLRHPNVLTTLASAKIVISAMGRNQISVWNDSTPATNPFKLMMIRWWENLRALGASKVYQTTITPFTEFGELGVDDIENQVEDTAGYNDEVIAANAWLMGEAVDSGLIDSCIDWTKNVTEVNSQGILAWKPGMTDQETTDFASGTDLLHPGEFGIYMMAQSVDMESLGLPAKSAQFTEQWDVPAGAILDAKFLETDATATIVNSAGDAVLSDNASGVTYTPAGYPCRLLSQAGTYIDITGLEFADTEKITLLAWIKPTQAINSRDYTHYLAGTTLNYYLKGVGGTHLYPTIHTDFFDNQCQFPLNEWHMIALTIDCATHQGIFYKDGVAGPTKTSNKSTIAHIAASLGKSDAGWTFDGSMSRFMIYNSVLTPAQILAIYNKSKVRFGL